MTNGDTRPDCQLMELQMIKVRSHVPNSRNREAEKGQNLLNPLSLRGMIGSSLS